MKVKFQADADLNRIILNATLRQEPLIDFQKAEIAGLRGLDDDKVLALSAKWERLLVTHDQSTMPGHFANFISSQESAGVLIVPQRLSLNRVVEDLILIWLLNEAEDWTNRIAYLPL